MPPWIAASVAAISLLLSVSLTHAETRVFVIASQSDGYGVDRCLTLNERCGRIVATAYCQTQQFSEAKSYRKVEPGEVTESSLAMSCRGACGDLVAIECTR